MPVVRSTKIREQNILALAQSLRADENLWAALLVALGALFLLLSFPFYPTLLVPFLAISVGVIAYKSPRFGTLIGILLAFPAIAYQSPVFAWVYVLIVAITLFEFLTSWSIISFLEIAILAPFAPPPFSILSGFVMLALAAAALYIGSKRSILIAVPAVLIVLLLSSLWVTENSAFMPLTPTTYAPKMDALQRNLKPEVSVFETVPSAAASVASLFSMEYITYVGPAFGKVWENLLSLLMRDCAFLQLVTYTAVLFLIGYIPGAIRGKRVQLISSLPLLLIPLNIYLISTLYPIPFDPSVAIYALLSIAALGTLEQFNITIGREPMLMKKEKAKSFGKFGLQDLGAGSAETLEDIGGYGDVKNELLESIVMPLRSKGIAYAYGIKPPKGVLLFGPPGCGKTMLMRALSKELSFGFYYVKCSDLLSEWYGQSEKNVSELFSIARKNAPCVLFFDEIDAIGKKRESYTADDVAPRLMSLFLAELDGFAAKKDIIVIGATNIPDALDPALMRPGRFDKIIYMPLPDREAREAVFRVHTKKIPISPDVDFGRLAEVSERYSGADIKNVCTEAARLAASEAAKKGVVIPVRMEHFTTVLESLRPSVSIAKLEDYEQFRLDFERRVGKEKKKVEEEVVRWSDVAGLEDVKTALLEAIEVPLLHEDLIKELKIRPSKGILLFGPPGCGKTMLVKAAANELNATFLTVSGASLMKKGYGESVSIIKETFNRGREQAPCIIFMDEMEDIASSREMVASSVLSQLLMELDGIKELKNVVLVGATNKPSMLDPAILRPGRFDKIIYIPPPDMESRKSIFSLNLSAVDAREIDFGEMAELTDGFTGADIASICQEAKMRVVRARIKKKESKITTAVLKDIAKRRKPSVTPSQLTEFALFMEEYGERK